MAASFLKGPEVLKQSLLHNVTVFCLVNYFTCVINCISAQKIRRPVGVGARRSGRLAKIVFFT